MGRQDRILLSGSSLHVSQIIDNLHDLAPYLGADTETVVNHIQRHCHSPRRQWERLTVRAMLRQALGPGARISYEQSGKPQLTFEPSNPEYQSLPPQDKSQISNLSDTPSAPASLSPSFFAHRPSAVTPAAPALVRDPFGVQISNPQYLSISHSKTHAALLLSSHKDIGVDIEQVSPRILRLADRLAQPSELPPDFAALPPGQQAQHLTVLWTVKEAVYKSLDRQDHIDLLTDITVSLQFPVTLPAEIAATVKGQAAPRMVHVMDYHGDILTATV